MYLYTCIITYNTCIYMYIYVHVYNISLAHDHCSAVSFPASPFAYIHNNFIRCIYLACIYACAQNVYYHYCDHYFVIKSTRLFLCFRTRGSKVIGWNHTERLGAKVIILCITMHVCSIRSYLMRANQLPIQGWIFFPSELCIYIYIYMYFVLCSSICVPYFMLHLLINLHNYTNIDLYILCRWTQVRILTNNFWLVC